MRIDVHTHLTFVREFGLSPEKEGLMLWKNAARLFRLELRRMAWASQARNNHVTSVGLDQ